MLASEVDYPVDIGFEGGAVDVVRGKQLLSLGGVVELFDEEVWDGVVRQARDLWRRRQHQEESHEPRWGRDLRLVAID